jgi:TatD DNase family protein
MSEQEKKIRYIDSHCHINSTLRESKIEPNLEEWEKFYKTFPESFECCINVNFTPELIESGVLYSKNTDNVYSAVGIHPLNADLWSEQVKETIIRMKKEDEDTGAKNIKDTPNRIVGIGECGLDYSHWSKIEKSVQKQVFIEQIKLAHELHLPLIIHTRDAEDDTWEIFQKHLPLDLEVHIHCFTGTKEFAAKVLEKYPNVYFGFTGVCTFKSGKNIRDAMEIVPLNRILVETDSPFLAPVPFRGKVCNSGMIPYTIKVMAKTMKISEEEMYQHCYENTKGLYKILN